jgi:hypothetical protein
MKRLLFLIFFPLALLAIGLFYCSKASGFSVDKIRSPFTFQAEWEVSYTPFPEGIFSQKYIYLKSGQQCYAFASEDGKYVIKFFKMKHLIPKTQLLAHLPFLKEYADKKIDQRIERHRRLFSNYKMAYEELKEETGLIYLHLNKTEHLQKKVYLLDKMGREHSIDLDRFEFVLQEKAELLASKLTQNLKWDEKQKLVEALLHLVKKRLEKGFSDRDNGVKFNYGFIGDRAIQIDVGRIARDASLSSPEKIECELQKIMRKLM